MIEDEKTKMGTGSPGTEMPVMPKGSSADKLGLEEIVYLSNKIGLEYADARERLDRLELMKPTIKARISMRLDDGRSSETKLRRATETDEEYIKHLEQLIEAKHQCEKLRIRYDSYKNLFDARRSLLSYQKAEMKLI